MASAQGLRAGRAFVELFADDSKLVRGLKAARKRLRAFGASVRAIGAKMFAAGALVAGPLALAVNAASDMEETIAVLATDSGSRSVVDRLLDHAETTIADLAESGHTKIRLSTGPDTPALQFYLKRGWRQVGTSPEGEANLELQLPVSANS